MGCHPTVIAVALPSPLRQLFDYHCTQTPLPPIGARVMVPFGPRKLIGIVVAHKNTSTIAKNKLRPVSALLDTQALIDAPMLALCQWVSDYYQYSLGEVFMQALPTYLRKHQEPAKSPYWKLATPLTETLLHQLKRAPRQQDLAKQLENHPQGLSQAMLAQLGFSRSHIMGLAEKKHIIATTQQPATRHFTTYQPVLAQPEQTPTTEQACCIGAITPHLHQFAPFLLDGVTGSGKTEIYLQLTRTVLEMGKQVLILVPEIGLAPQTLTRFKRRFSVPVTVLHSGLSDRERLHGWQAARCGQSGISIGTRSAIFTAFEQLGLVIVDEEHDSAYKQQDSVRYSARDIAVWRARQLNIPILLGSATPSLESLHNSQLGRYQHLYLNQRTGQAQAPALTLLDIRQAPLYHGIAPDLLQRITHHLHQGQQVLVFLNRRGYAPTLLCNQCGWLAQCPHCDANMTLHRTPYRLHCHHCDYKLAPPQCCPSCHARQWQAKGLGTEHTEQALQEYFKNVPIIRIDRDSTRKKNAFNQLLEPVHNGMPCILIGTQMLAKGHHFPHVTLVAVLNADSELFSADFRGLERSGQLLVQVAGRAGRADHSGSVIMQTANPEHPALCTLVQQDYRAFAQQQLDNRQHMQLPPYHALTLLRADALKSDQAQQWLALAKDRLSQWLQQHNHTIAASLIGPLPAPMEKRQGRYRALLIFKTASRPLMTQALRAVTQALEKDPLSRKVRWSVDVDAQLMQ